MKFSTKLWKDLYLETSQHHLTSLLRSCAVYSPVILVSLWAGFWAMEVPSRVPFQATFRDSFHSSAIKVISALMWLKETFFLHSALKEL